MSAGFAEVDTADFSEICLLVSVAGEARVKIKSIVCEESVPIHQICEPQGASRG